MVHSPGWSLHLRSQRLKCGARKWTREQMQYFLQQIKTAKRRKGGDQSLLSKVTQRPMGVRPGTQLSDSGPTSGHPCYSSQRGLSVTPTWLFGRVNMNYHFNSLYNHYTLYVLLYVITGWMRILLPTYILKLCRQRDGISGSKVSQKSPSKEKKSIENTDSCSYEIIPRKIKPI